ncbi:phosphomevalonate kinase [Sporodiniella umbellata]|nr:phosphomevalonate kinase [Sporodiniella umbellata]
MSHSTVVSAPGKVLLTGGYLVLEQAYSGCVVGTSSRFYTVIKRSSEPNVISVRSPQFENALWTYQVSDTLELTSLTSDDNKFVAIALQVTLQLIQDPSEIFKHGLDIVVVGDNDFYSQRLQLQTLQLPNTAESLASLEPFCSTQTTLRNVHKTGLGSSAALITSFVAALLLHFKCIENVTSNESKRWIHNTAQFVHCFAQGKIGSGFDVSSAVWGSHRYTRFSPDILKPIMSDTGFDKTLETVINQEWDNKVVPFALPPGFEMILADIDAGSHTPTLVGKVIEWKKTKSVEANALWKELSDYNTRVEQHFRNLVGLHQQHPTEYDATFKAYSLIQCKQWSLEGKVANELNALVKDFDHVRLLLRKMGSNSDVPIEPEEQTELLDACMQVPGVVMAGVPGAGGYDAIFCIVLSKEAKQRVRDVWKSWEKLSVGPLLSQADSNGITQPSLEDVPGLARFLAE